MNDNRRLYPGVVPDLGTIRQQEMTSRVNREQVRLSIITQLFTRHYNLVLDGSVDSDKYERMCINGANAHIKLLEFEQERVLKEINNDRAR